MNSSPDPAVFITHFYVQGHKFILLAFKCYQSIHFKEKKTTKKKTFSCLYVNIFMNTGFQVFDYNQ